MSRAKPFLRCKARCMPRVETAPLVLGSDWPGVFVRGDNAWSYAGTLTLLLERPELAAVLDAMPGLTGENIKNDLWGLVALFRSCNLSVQPDFRAPVQRGPELTHPRHEMINWYERGSKLRKVLEAHSAKKP